MKNRKLLTTGGIVALALAAMVPASAIAQAPSAPTFGSAAILTNRACTTTANGDCRLAPARNFTQYAGGAGSAFATSATNEANSGASGSAYASFTGSAVPALGVASFAGAATRTGASALAYQTFTYGGSAAINLALTGTLHYVGSGSSTSSTTMGVEPGGSGFFGANLTILPTSVLDDIEESIAAVPESAAWSMMILGFGFCGTALRRRPTPTRRDRDAIQFRGEMTCARLHF